MTSAGPAQVRQNGSSRWSKKVRWNQPTNITQQQQTQWRFSGSALQRARTAMRLQRDLGINLAGVALAMDLLDEIEELRGRLRRQNQMPTRY